MITKTMCFEDSVILVCVTEMISIYLKVCLKYQCGIIHVLCLDVMDKDILTMKEYWSVREQRLIYLNTMSFLYQLWYFSYYSHPILTSLLYYSPWLLATVVNLISQSGWLAATRLAVLFFSWITITQMLLVFSLYFLSWLTWLQHNLACC